MSDQPKSSSAFALFCTTLLFLPCMLLAKLAAQTSINNVTIDESTVSKRRHWYASLFRIPGNLILGFRRAPVKVLSTSQWLEREQKLANATVSENAAVLKKLDGIPLSEFLATESSSEQKIAAVSAAVASLYEFHFQQDQSHGDASAANVMIYELPHGKFLATWFDFDVAHKESVSEVIRRSDDLRALFFTSKHWLNIEEFAQLFAGTESPYTDDDVWKELIETMSNPFQHSDIFHLAQQKRAIDSISRDSN